jgi:hypothetical protein
MGLATILAVVAIILALIALVLPFVVTHASTNTTTQGTPNVTLFAVVNSNGTLSRGVGVNNSTQIATGVYIVTFNQTLFGCTFQAGVGTNSTGTVGGGTATVVLSPKPYNSSYNVTVTTTNSTLNKVNNSTFHVVAICPGGWWAVVGPNGYLLNGAGASNSSSEGTGAYQVFFTAGTHDCAFVAGLGSSFGSSPGGTATTAIRDFGTSGVWVTTWNSQGVQTNETFHLQVFC